MGFSVLHFRRFAAGVLCAATLVLSSAAQAQVADDPQFEGLSASGRGFRLQLEETSVLVIELPWARSQKATAESPQEIETGSAPLVDLVGYTALHSTCPLSGLDEHERPRFTWTMPEIRRTSWAWSLLCLADRHGDSPQCWENDVTAFFKQKRIEWGSACPGRGPIESLQGMVHSRCK